MKHYIVCGDSREYFDYLKRTNTGPRTHVYLHDVTQIRGLSEVHGVFVGFDHFIAPLLQTIIQYSTYLQRVNR